MNPLSHERTPNKSRNRYRTKETGKGSVLRITPLLLTFVLLSALLLGANASASPISYSFPLTNTAPNRIEVDTAEAHVQSTTTSWEEEGSRILHLLVGDDTYSFLGFQPRIKVITASLPMASLQPKEEIILSTGILNLIGDDEEFAFIIAHEIAHRMLRHNEMTETTHSDYRQEIEADALALELMSGCNMGSSGASSLLQKLVHFGGEHGFRLGDYYPTLKQRSSLIATKKEALSRS